MRKIQVLALLLVVVALPASAQLAGTIGFDLVPGSPHFDGSTGTAVTDDSPAIDKAISVNAGDTFKALVRVNGAENLLGVTFDFGFDSTKLEVKDIRETRMDLDFNGQQSFAELDAIVTFFLDALSGGSAAVSGFSYTYDDGTGMITTKPGVLIDLDNNGSFAFEEIDPYITEFLSNLDQSDVPFWTEVVSRRSGFNESVEIFDTPAEINAAGQATDNTSVLLRRNGVDPNGFGFDSASFGSAIVLEVTFHALPGAASGATDITISGQGTGGIAQGIDENFASLADIKDLAVDGPSTVTIN
jgi:hypothetical protein